MTFVQPPVPALALRGLAKRFGTKIAVDGISLDVPAGSFYGIVGPNGAGKTTTLSMATGLLRPDFGTALVHGVDVWQHPLQAKKLMGVLPDGVRLFDRLTGEQLVSYAAWNGMSWRRGWRSCWPPWTSARTPARWWWTTPPA